MPSRSSPAPFSSSLALLAPDDQPITARLAAAGSRLRELQAVLHATSPTASPAELRRLVLGANIAGKQSAVSREKVWGQLRARYLLDPSSPEYHAFRCAMGATDPRDQGLAACLMCARTNRLFREVTAEVISPHLRQDGEIIAAESVHAAVEARVHKARAHWSRLTTLRVRQHICASLKDFGLLRGSRSRRTVVPRPGPDVVLFAAQLGRLEGLTDRQVLTARWFAVLGLDRQAAVDLLYGAARYGRLAFRLQADVVEMKLPACHQEAA